MLSGIKGPVRLSPIFRERVWGRHSLEPFFRLPAIPQPIGEVWFTSNENQTSAGISLSELLTEAPEVLGTAADPAHPGLCPLLVKLLFTTERLSVQVHPDDQYALEHHGSLGKTEAWYVIAAEPPGEIAVGFREPISGEVLTESARSGDIERLLDWRSVTPGDAVYVPAGTVHAIGAGLIICEIQENSDITYRIFDYGRPRELHLSHATAVAKLHAYDESADRMALAPWREQLAVSSYFRIERLRPPNALRIDAGLPHYLLLLCLSGAGTIGEEHFQPGECWLAPASGAAIEITGPGCEWILTYTAEHALDAIHSA